MSAFTETDALSGVKAIGAPEKAGSMQLLEIERHSPKDFDVVIDVKYCGICHTDVHFIDGDMGVDSWPMIPGHEIAGIVRWAGKDTEYKKGDRVGVGSVVDSCMECAPCQSGTEQYCTTGPTFTYASPSKYGRACSTGEDTKGGYSKLMVVHSRFVAPVPDELALEKACPILCAGVTVYDPFVHWKAGSDGVKNVGVVGGGGVGMMGIKIAKALGCEVTAVTRSTTKVDDLKRAGADKVLVSTDEESMKEAAGSLDLILDTVPAEHPIVGEVGLLARDGRLVVLGFQRTDLATLPFCLGRKCVASSFIGGMPATKEVLQFCAKHDILPDTELVGADKVNDVYETLREGTTGLKRYVVDIGNM